MIRSAVREDVPDIVRMLADDELGSEREDYRDPLPDFYYKAFDEILVDGNQKLLVYEKDSQVLATMQLSFIPYLTYKGRMRAQIEAVRVDKSVRGLGVGQLLFEEAIRLAKEKGCHLVQLTTDKSRPEALKFYKKLGFVDSHLGLKLKF